MAKGEEPKGDYEYKPPNFDEDAFIHRELVSFRTTTILFVVGIVAALASWGAYMAMGGGDSGWWVGLLICALFGVSLKVLYPRLGADITHFGRKEWLGTGFLFFCTWLSFFILAINPPVTDLAAPQVGVVPATPIQQAGSDLSFEVLATDNDRLAAPPAVTVTRDGQTVAATITDLGDGRVRATIPDAPAGTYLATATARDARDREGTNARQAVVGNVLRLEGPSRLASASDQLLVRFEGSPDSARPCNGDDPRSGGICIRTVELRREGAIAGTPGILFEHREAAGGWTATANHKGWVQGPANYTVVATYLETFLGAHRLAGGEVVGETRTIDVATSIGTFEPSVVAQPPQRSIPLPAPAFVFAVAVLLGAAVVMRRRQA